VTAAGAATAWIDEIVWGSDGPPWLSMGLSRIAPGAWLVPDEHRDHELGLRARLLEDRHDDVFGALDGTERAGAETLALVRDWERANRPDLATVAVADGVHPLEAAGRRTQEDLVVMVAHDDGYHLDAAVLCFPSHWRLADKLGGSASAIHGPVPHYRTDLADRVDRFLDRLRPDVVVTRRNWSVHDDDELFSPVAPSAPAPVTVDRVADSLWLRSERQTLRRLPASGAVLFTIRVQQAPFGALRDHRGAAAALARRLATQPAEVTEMNGLAPHHAAVSAWLGQVAENVGGPGAAGP